MQAVRPAKLLPVPAGIKHTQSSGGGRAGYYFCGHFDELWYLLVAASSGTGIHKLLSKLDPNSEVLLAWLTSDM